MTVPFYIKNKTRVIDTISHCSYQMQTPIDAQNLCRTLTKYYGDSVPNVQKQFRETLMSLEVLNADMLQLKRELL